MTPTGNKDSLKIAKGAAATIKALMAQQGVTQADIARETGKTAQYVSNALNPGGTKYEDKSTGSSWSNAPRLETYQTFAGVLGVALTVDVDFVPLPPESKGKLTPKKKGGKKKNG